MKMLTGLGSVKRAEQFPCSRQRTPQKAPRADAQHTQGTGDQRGPNSVDRRCQLRHSGKSRNTPQVIGME